MADMSCASCGASNRDGVKFCTTCGTALAATCRHCGATGESGRFCGECGGALALSEPAADAAANPALPSPRTSPPVTERRIASLLFADLVGFTPLSESRDPEAVRELLSAYFERTRAVIERYGGTVEKFIGDAVFAVWGVPTAREDDAERAVRAGLDLVSEVSALGEEVGAPGLQMRVGITTGQVAVTLGAVGEGMVAGDAVNTASRVQAAATPGDVWVDDTTRSLTSASVAYEPTGMHELKGKSTPIALFRTIRTTAVIGGDQRVDGLEAPFVGRDRELRVVKELFHATAEEQRPRLLVVAGEPGIGKSRLAWEFEKYADAITSNRTHWLRGRCLSYGQGVAGRVVAEMLRSLLRVADTDPGSALQEALDARLMQCVPDAAERDVLRPRVQSVLGLTDQSFDQGDLFACWRGFLEALTRDGSQLTLVIEDLQWADDGLLDFIEHLLTAARSPILLLALARPEVADRRAGLGSGRRATTVFLEPLPDAAMARLLDGLVPNLPDQLRDELVGRAAGVPLYAVETVRSLIDRDVVVPQAGRYVVDEAAVTGLDLAQLAPPPSLQALLASRLDALSADERRVVQDASVLGLAFSRAALASLTPDEAGLDDVLTSLQRKEILALDTDPRSPERGQYRFVQALLHGVAYDTLSRRDRKARHVAVATHLSSLPDADAIAAVLAAHYLDAATAVPEDPDAAELRGRAIELFEQAAVHAADIGAPRDALTHYARLFELDAPAAVLIRSALVATDLAWLTGTHTDDIAGWARKALDAAIEAGDEDAVLQLRLWTCAGWNRPDENLREILPEVLEIFEACVGVPRRVHITAHAAAYLAQIAARTADVDLARDAALRALPDIERYGDDTAYGWLLHALGGWFWQEGHRRLTVLLARGRAEHQGQRTGDMVVAMTNYGLSAMNEDLPAAVDAARRAIEAVEAAGLSAVPARCALVMALVGAGRWAEAVDELSVESLPADDTSQVALFKIQLAAIAAVLAWCKNDGALLQPVSARDSDAFGMALPRGWQRMVAAAGRGLDGDLATASDLALEGLDSVAGQTGPIDDDVTMPAILAIDLLVESGDRAGLQRVVELFDATAPRQRSRLLDGQFHRARGHLADDPVPDLRDAVQIFDAMGAAYWAARTRVELAEALRQAGEETAAATEIAAAEPLLREIGAGRALARLDAQRVVPVG